MRGCDLWFLNDSPVPPYINWYQSKYSEHSYGPTVLATGKIHRHEHVHKSSNRDKSHSSDYSKHVQRSRNKDEDKSSSHSKHVHKFQARDEIKSSYHSRHVHTTRSRDEGKSSYYSKYIHNSRNKDVGKSSSHSKHVHKTRGRDESKSSYHSIHVHTIRSRDEGKSSYYSKHGYNSYSKDEGKSSSHSRHIHKSRSRNENKSSSHSPYVHKHNSRDEIPVPDFSRPLQLIKSLREYIIAYIATQHAPAITNSKSKISEEASCIPEIDKLLDSDCLSEGVHKDDNEDISPEDPAPIIFPSDTITPVTDVLSPGDPSPNTIPSDTITQVTDGDPTPITSPSDSISPVANDHSSLEEEKQEKASHMLSHHYVGDPYLHDIIWCNGLPYQQILVPSPTRGMLLLLMNCLSSSSPTMQMQSLLFPEPLPKINTIDSLWKQRPPRRPPER